MTTHERCRHLSIVIGCGAPECPVLAAWRAATVRYVEARSAALSLRHHGCDHAYGICQEPIDNYNLKGVNA